MKKYFKILRWSFLCFSYCLCIQAQNDDKDHSIGLSIGTTIGGPAGNFSEYLEREGFGITTGGSFFGPTTYPVIIGPRASYSLSYQWKQKNGKYLGLDLNLNELAEVAGLNNSGRRVEVGFKSYTIGVDYTFGPGITKLSIGPALMFNNAYSIEFKDFKESKEKIDTSIAFGLKLSALFYLWNKSVTYSKIGISYMISYPVEQGPFPLNDNNDGTDELEETKLNYSHGSVFFSLGIKLF